jgi:hypothetical protein
MNHNQNVMYTKTPKKWIAITKYSPSWNGLLIYPEWNLRKDHCHDAWNICLNHKIAHLSSEVKVNCHYNVFTCNKNGNETHYSFCRQLFNGFIIRIQTNKQYFEPKNYALCLIQTMRNTYLPTGGTEQGMEWG